MTIEKFALINIDRTHGPKVFKQRGFKKEEETNMLLYALPSGEAYNGSFKYIEITNTFYSSYIKINEKSEGMAAVIAIPIDLIKFNPFNLNQFLQKMVEDEELPDTIDIDKLNQNVKKQDPINISGATYIVGSLFLAHRIILVGSHEEVLEYLANIYEGVPYARIPSIVTLTYSKYLRNSYNFLGVPNSEILYKDLERAQKDSTILFLEKKKAFGLYRSPFTDKIAKLYLKGDYDRIKKEVIEFVKLSFTEKIESSGDFAIKYHINRADAKLLKLYQLRTEELKNLREQYPQYRRLN